MNHDLLLAITSQQQLFLPQKQSSPNNEQLDNIWLEEEKKRIGPALHDESSIFLTHFPEFLINTLNCLQFKWVHLLYVHFT